MSLQPVLFSLQQDQPSSVTRVVEPVTRWPIGRFRGRRIESLPLWLIQWYLDQRWLRSDLREALDDELARRFDGR
jgi:hypothetical protein